MSRYFGNNGKANIISGWSNRVDPSVFRRYFREEEEKPKERDNEGGEVEASSAGGYNRSDKRDYKMPEKKKKKKTPDSDSDRLVDISSPTPFQGVRAAEEEPI